MKKLGLALLGIAAVWLLVLGLFVPVYIETGPTGDFDFDCAAVWQQQSPHSFEVPGWSERCQQAIDRRREVLILPVIVACGGCVLPATTSVRKRRGAGERDHLAV